jgi:hypothetical protein
MPLRIQIQFFINIKIYSRICLFWFYKIEASSTQIVNISININI